MKRMRLFTKTFLYTMLLMSIIILISHMLLYFMMPSVYLNNKVNSANELATTLEEQTNNKSQEEVLEVLKQYSTEHEASITLQVEDHTYVYSNITSVDVATSESSVSSQLVTFEKNITDGELEEGSIDSSQKLSSSLTSFSTDVGLTAFNQSDNAPIIIKKDITLSNQENATLSITMGLQPVSDASNVMFSILPYTIGISILLSLCAAYFYARAITQPIQAICSSTKQMETLKQDAQCIVASQDEIGELAESINHLYTTLQETIVSLEQEIAHVSQVEQMKVDFLRGASHELKTPLTSLSVILENMMLDIGKYKDHPTYLKKCQDIVSHLSSMVKEIIDASSLESSNKEAYEAIDVEEWIIKQIEPYEIIAKAKGISMKLQMDTSFILHQNRTLLSKVISNVLSNAVQYTESNHTITITVSPAFLKVENECTPIDEHHLPHITEAFYRPDFSHDKQTGGNGLGLYLVDQILRLLQISYTFVPYEQGMCFTLYFEEV